MATLLQTIESDAEGALQRSESYLSKLTPSTLSADISTVIGDLQAVVAAIVANKTQITTAAGSTAIDGAALAAAFVAKNPTAGLAALVAFLAQLGADAALVKQVVAAF